MFNVFISAVKNNMKLKLDTYGWSSLLVAGSEEMAMHLKKEKRLEVKPEVTVEQQKKKASVDNVVLKMETTKFHFIRTRDGKEKHLFKEFVELKKEFCKQLEEK